MLALGEKRLTIFFLRRDKPSEMEINWLKPIPLLRLVSDRLEITIERPRLLMPDDRSFCVGDESLSRGLPSCHGFRPSEEFVTVIVLILLRDRLKAVSRGCYSEPEDRRQHTGGHEDKERQSLSDGMLFAMRLKTFSRAVLLLLCSTETGEERLYFHSRTPKAGVPGPRLNGKPALCSVASVYTYRRTALVCPR